MLTVPARRRRFSERQAARFISALLLASTATCERAAPRTLILATTTSLEDSGLLGELVPAYSGTQPDVRIQVISVGSGQALALGRAGDADVLLVHSPADEEEFMASGLGSSRETVMTNDFVIVGPRADPAGVRGGTDAIAALQQLAVRGATWVSRGDNSGTHRAEQRLRAQMGDSALNVLQVGQGMAETLALTAERGGYTLSDRSTYLSLQPSLALDVLVEGDLRLRNTYSVITVRDTRHAEEATAFAQWLLSNDAQKLIADFGRARFGKSLFTPVHPEAAVDGSARR